MKKNLPKILMIVAVVATILASCKKNNQTADFDYSGCKYIDYDNDETEITFTNKSQKSTSYEWDFGDGTKSTELNAKHKYKVGSFTVTLTSNGEEGVKSVSKNIAIVDRGRIRITNITLYAFNEKKKYDPSDGPDIYFSMSVGPSGVDKSKVVQNVTHADLPLKLEIGADWFYSLQHFEQNMYMGFSDYDSGGGDGMGGINIPQNKSFQPERDCDNGYKNKTINVQIGEGDTAVKFSYEIEIR
ncbi:MAG: PKD domain-containing protein [Bacteroidetes bacterium]|nr:PKD domain-containing protein [Bacteroidota bacterium]